ncbi:MAG: nicotinate-nucleotide--dimethylbenzimidazole phosphoribosyltransferase [Oscillospiraceae bacterium]|jgi:nicotinate-nucleotide--dimethylbenzimidazole phosphoribosyltransferase|nr:nicotinate-nucleotide--dimethylbenzimidazole phosphoribosyltransferase [Oscillospiraceae bacterium]
MDFTSLNAGIPEENAAVREAARARWDAVAKPLGSLGLLEDAITRIAAVTGDIDARIDRRAVLVLCADNGVVAEGVTQSDSSVTMLVAENLTKRRTSVCLMAAAARADVFPVDMGMNELPAFEGILSHRAGYGTANLRREPAMTIEQAERCVLAGIELVRDMKSRGYNILATGEMGIGNTTTSAALCSALLGLPAEETTGRGAGLSDIGLKRKLDVINDALRLHKNALGDPLRALAALGGFDIAGMAGIFIGGAKYGIPVLIDGFISSVAALTAARLCPRCVPAMLASHVSGEPAGGAVLSALGLAPMIYAGMRLGEGTGAVAALPLLDLALAVYRGSSSFDEIGLEQYSPL